MVTSDPVCALSMYHALTWTLSAPGSRRTRSAITLPSAHARKLPSGRSFNPHVGLIKGLGFRNLGFRDLGFRDIGI